MKKNYRVYIFSGILIFYLGCETQISDYDIKTFAVTQIDNNACEQFYNYNLEKTITTTDLDTVYNDLDSLYAFILGDTSSLLNINNTQITEIKMTSDTTYLSGLVGQAADSTYFFSDASVDIDVINSSGNSIAPNWNKSTLEDIAACPNVRTRSVFDLEPGYYIFELKALEAKIFNVVFINSNIAPSASFSASPLIGIDSLEVSFSDMSLEGTFPITSWMWNFGDNSSDSTRFLQNPIHQYNRADTFSVSLTVSDGILKSTIVMDNFIQITETDTSSVNE